MAHRDKAPAPIVTKTPNGIAPVSAGEAERLFADPIGTEYDLVKRSRRSNRQHRLYWETLSRVVKATSLWPTHEHLHHELKLVCGYRMQVVDWETGEVSTAVDSTAFDAMTQDEFQAYFDRAMEKLAGFLRSDPLAFLEEAA